jgi:hypothetical protein
VRSLQIIRANSIQSRFLGLAMIFVLMRFGYGWPTNWISDHIAHPNGLLNY